MNFINAELSINSVKVEGCTEYTEITGRLEGWKLTNKGRQIVGQIYSDREGRFQDDTLIITSTLLSMSQQICSPMEGSVVSTQNSNYLLGKRG